MFVPFLFLFVVNFTCILNAMPLAKRMVDMTYVFDETTLNYPTVKRFQIDDLIKNYNFNGIWIQKEEYSSGTHIGTHMDAPSHFSKGGITIEQIPVTDFIAPAAVIDISAKAERNSDAEVAVEDLQLWESGTSKTLNGTIVLMRSGWGQKWSNRTAFLGTPDNETINLHYPGFSAEACQWLVDNRNIVGIGTDTISIDKGQTRDFMSHQIITAHGIFILGNVANMDKIPIYGAKLYVFPMKIGKASGAPTRIVATIPEVLYQ